MTDPVLDTLNKKKRALEKEARDNPKADYSQQWLDLANEYQAAGSRANHAYCLTRAGVKIEKPASQDDAEGYEFDWQSRSDIED